MLTKDVFNNCIGVDIKNNVYYPVRFSPKQFEFFKNHSEFVFIRSLCTADVFLEFNTSSKIITFSCITDKFVRKFCSFDIYENDEFIENIPFPGRPETIDISYKKRKPGISKITIYLPYHCRAGIYNFNANIIPANKTPVKKLKILTYGDSITQGMFSEYPSFTYPLLISKYFGAELLNQGVGGMPFNKDSLDPDLTFVPDIITVAYGTIDLTETTTYEEVVFNAREYLRKLKSISGESKIYVMSALDSPTLRLRWEKRNSLHRIEWYPLFANALKTICEETGIHFIDGLYLVPNIPEFYVEDGHPNAQGFLIYALNLAKYIEI